MIETACSVEAWRLSPGESLNLQRGKKGHKDGTGEPEGPNSKEDLTTLSMFLLYLWTAGKSTTESL